MMPEPPEPPEPPELPETPELSGDAQTVNSPPVQPQDPPQPGETRPGEAHDTPQPLHQKRRGRPPGRPNKTKTAQEADYSDNFAVQRWNAAKFASAMPAVAISIRDALPEAVLTRDFQREMHQMPSREIIYFVEGWITARQIASQRPSYINGLLIHSRGEDSPACDQCAEKRAKNALGPFLVCRVLVGAFHNSCSNCKWFDTTAACSLYTGPKPNRKRKAKGDGGADGVVDESLLQEVADNGVGTAAAAPAKENGDVVANLTSTHGVVNDTNLSAAALPQEPQENVDVVVDLTPTHGVANGTDLSTVTLPQGNGNLSITPENGDLSTVPENGDPSTMQENDSLSTTQDNGDLSATPENGDLSTTPENGDPSTTQENGDPSTTQENGIDMPDSLVKNTDGFV